MSDSDIPRWMIRLLRAACPDHLIEEIEGDILQRFHKDQRSFGKQKAKIRFMLNALCCLRPGIILRNKFSFHLIRYDMLRNYLLISFRNMRLSPLYAFINMFSLAIGLSTCLIIYLFISDELSFDSFHSKRESIYRIYTEPHYAGSSVKKVALTMGWVGPLMASDFTDISNFTRYWKMGKMVFKRGQEQFLVNDVASVDSTFLDVFDFQLVAGNRTTVLDEPNAVVLTEETAAKFFKHPFEAVGNSITIRDSEFQITGILKQIPENSHLHFDALQSISTYSRKDPTFTPKWEGSFLNTYVVLQPGANKNELESKFGDFLVRHTGKKDFEKDITLLMQSLSDVHLGSMVIEHDYNNHRRFNGSYIAVFKTIGIFILLIACVNFMNLTTARASYRWKEIGIRKSVGAKKLQLFGQFIFESTLLAMLALVLSVLLDALFLPFLNNLIGRQLTLTSLLANGMQIWVMIIITLGLGLLTGIYPSFYITSFNVMSVLKGGTKSEGKSVFQSSLVVLQFALAIAMIIGTLAVTKQLSFMKNSDIGFDKEQIMLLHMNAEVNQKFETLKTELLRNSLIKGATASSQRIGNNFNAWGFKVRMDTGVYSFTPSNVNVDYDYLKVYSIELKEGRNFSKNFLTDKGKAFIINETMEKELRMKDPVGTPAGHAWYENDSLGAIIGVAKDFNYNSLHAKIGMLALVCHPEWGYDEMSVKIDGAHAQEAIAAVKEIWDKNISTYPFSYTFLDEHFDNLYQSDQQLSSVVTITAAFAILISCIGLFGLVAITTKKKVKEIGIRKVLGASGIQIATMLSTSFTKLIAISFVIVSPLTYYFLSEWLETFSYRVSIDLWLFISGGLIAILIALVTISYNIIRSARENPVNSLRYE